MDPLRIRINCVSSVGISTTWLDLILEELSWNDVRKQVANHMQLLPNEIHMCYVLHKEAIQITSTPELRQAVLYITTLNPTACILAFANSLTRTSRTFSERDDTWIESSGTVSSCPHTSADLIMFFDDPNDNRLDSMISEPPPSYSDDTKSVHWSDTVQFLPKYPSLQVLNANSALQNKFPSKYSMMNALKNMGYDLDEKYLLSVIVYFKGDKEKITSYLDIGKNRVRMPAASSVVNKPTKRKRETACMEPFA